jgi:hypothetical protein
VRYSTTEQEALVVMRCLWEARWLVLGSKYPVIVDTDHSALIHKIKHDDLRLSVRGNPLREPPHTMSLVRPKY